MRSALLAALKTRAFIGALVLGPALLCPGALAAEAAAAVPTRSPEPALRVALERSLSARALKGAQISALVVDDADGRVLFERAPDRALLPASNLKILTALASLRSFGPTHRFETRIHADAPLDPDGAVGSLYVVGGGDPGLTSEDYWRLASDLRQAGLRRVRGDLVFDDSRFDGEFWHPSWLPITARAYHAPVSALTANYGAFAVAVSAGEAPGDPVRVSIDPPLPYLKVVNRGTTVARGARRRGVVDRRESAGVFEVVVAGSWPVGDQRTYYRGVLDPAAYAANLLRLQLEALGIEVAGEVRRAYLPEGAPELLAFEGRPLSDVVLRFLKYSSNPTGEALVKALGMTQGAPGGWKSGAGIVRRELEALGLPTAGLVIVDGSGLSRSDRATSRLLVEALRAAKRSFAFGAEFVSALPIAGADGTLEKRAHLAGERVRAKTGLLSDVTGLSGFAQRPDGSTAVFSVLANGFRDADGAMDALDAFAAALVGGVRGPAELD